MELGAFSVSLTVRDINLSFSFYQKLGFVQFHGDIEQKWLILKNGNTVIGLFEGMFESNILTFNPGWDSDAQAVAGFTDIRNLQKEFRAAGLQLASEADETTTGPASLTLVDPDGNMILLDQHL